MTTRTLRILRVIPTVDPQYGGPVEGMRQSTKFLETRGHSTEVLTLDDPRANFLDTFPAPVHPQGRLFKKYGYSRNLSRWVSENSYRFDIAVIHGLWTHASVGGSLALKKAGLPYVIFTHGMMDKWFKEVSFKKHIAKQIFWTLAQGRVLRDAHQVLFTSLGEKERSKGVFYGSKFRSQVVAYGSAEPNGRRHAQVSEFRNSVVGLQDNRFILFMSRIHPKKGCDLLVESFIRTASVDPLMHLVVAGPDECGLVETLQRKIEAAGLASRVHFPGMLQGSRKWGALQASSAFILPSHQENFGISVAEATATGIPVLISDQVNIWREIESSDAGLVECDDLDGTTKLLEKFYTLNREQQVQMGARARQCYLTNFSVEAAAVDLEKALLRALGQSVE